MGQQHGRRAVVQHVGQALGRIARIERHVGRTGFQDAEQARDHLDAAFNADRDAVVGPYAQRQQAMRDLIGAPVQICVAECLVFEQQRHRIRRRIGLRFEQAVDQWRAVERDLGGVPGSQRGAARITEQVEAADRIVVACQRHRTEQACETVGDALRGRGIEQRGGVVETPVDDVARFRQGEVEIELRGVDGLLHRLDVQPLQPAAAGRRVVQAKHHLEQRRMPHAAHRLERLDDLLEG